MTSLSNHTGVCASFGWFWARKWGVLCKEKFWDWGLIFAGNSGNAQVWDNQELSNYFVLQTLVRNHIYILELGF